MATQNYIMGRAANEQPMRIYDCLAYALVYGKIVKTFLR